MNYLERMVLFLFYFLISTTPTTQTWHCPNYLFAIKNNLSIQHIYIFPSTSPPHNFFLSVFESYIFVFIFLFLFSLLIKSLITLVFLLLTWFLPSFCILLHFFFFFSTSFLTLPLNILGGQNWNKMELFKCKS